MNKDFYEIPSILKSIINPIIVDGKRYSNLKEWSESSVPNGNYTIVFNCDYTPNLLKITVSDSMLKKSNDSFKFQSIYNNDIPMPLSVMYGNILEENDRMYKMTLWDKSKKINWKGWVLKGLIKELIKYE